VQISNSKQNRKMPSLHGTMKFLFLHFFFFFSFTLQPPSSRTQASTAPARLAAWLPAASSQRLPPATRPQCPPPAAPSPRPLPPPLSPCCLPPLPSAAHPHLDVPCCLLELQSCRPLEFQSSRRPQVTSCVAAPCPWKKEKR
jgi:hypothetical protein